MIDKAASPSIRRHPSNAARSGQRTLSETAVVTSANLQVKPGIPNGAGFALFYKRREVACLLRPHVGHNVRPFDWVSEPSMRRAG
jgi:hypothetical protein